MLRVFLFWVLIFQGVLFSEEVTSLFPKISLASTEGVVDSLVCGHVCVISGDLVDTEVDFVLPGSEPVSLSRSYQSKQLSFSQLISGELSNDFSMNLPWGWRWNHGLWVTVGEGPFKAVGLHTPGGGVLIYQHGGTKHLYSLQGITNAASSEISARSNLKNIGYHFNGSQKVNFLEGSGVVHHFQQHPLLTYQGSYFGGEDYYSIKTFLEHQLIRTNQTFLDYEYNKGQLKGLKIKGKNGRKLGHIELTHEEIKKSKKERIQKIIASSSHGQTATYTTQPLEPEQGTHYQLKATYSHKPEIEYAYKKIAPHEPLCLVKKKWGDKRHYLKIDYFPDADRRVKALKAPHGPGGKEIAIARFEYNPKGCFTAVFDALGRRTHYVYNDQDRLEEICRFVGAQNDRPYVKERFKWYPNDSENVGNLKEKAIVDTNGAVISSERYEYDKKGNVTQKVLRGNFSGKGDLETYKITQAFDSSAFSNLLSIEEMGRKFEYRYFPNSSILASKHYLENGSTCIRESYKLDQETSAYSEISVDDGYHDDDTNLQGVMERHVKKMQLTPIGLPKMVEEWSFNSATGEYALCKARHLKYQATGEITEETVFDANYQPLFTLQWDYNDHGKVIRERNALGQETFRKYDLNDRLKRLQGPREDVHFEYQYDLADRLVVEKEIHHDGQQFCIVNTYDEIGNKIKVTDIFGQETHYKYDKLNRCILTIGPDGAETHTKYNLLNQPVEITYPLGNKTCTSYNVRGKPTQIHYPNGTCETFLYNLDGSLKESTSKNGLLTRYEWDLQGRLLSKQEFSVEGKFFTGVSNTYNAFHLLSSKDREGNVTQFKYDCFGRLCEVKSPLKTKRFEYDAQGRLFKTIEGEKVTVQVFDLLNRVIEERVESLGGEVFTKIQKAYDAQGNCTHIWTGEGALTYTEYNPKRLPTLIIDPQGNKTFFHYKYDEVLTKTITDPLGQITIEVHDVCGRLVKVIKKNAFGLTLAEQAIEYDLNGNKVAIHEQAIAQGQILKHTTRRMEYNSMNQLQRLVEAAGTCEQRVTSHEYNTFGEKSKTIKPDGITLNYLYNERGALNELFSSDHTIHYRYSYNGNLLPTIIEDLINHTSNYLAYDQDSQLVKETLGNELEVHYSYDDQGRVNVLKLPDDSVIQYSYTACALQKVQRGEVEHTYDRYNLLGKVTEATLANGQKMTFKYELDGRPKEIVSPYFREKNFSFDGQGNLLGYEYEDAYGIAENHFSYDDLYQLTAENDHNYSYDSLYNRLSKDDAQYCLNVFNQISSIGNETYKYDLNGNLIEKNAHEGSTTYIYDALDRLISLTNSKGTSSFQYDSFNRRLTANNKRFLYQGQNEIGAYEEEKLTELRMLGLGKGADIGAAVAHFLQDSLYVPIHDHNGNVVCLVDESGKPHSYRYTAYGEQIKAPDIPNPWCFASKRHDDSGLIYFGRRYYDPSIGRWTTNDPIGYDDGPNLYAFLNNNPLLSIDLYGLWIDRDAPGGDEKAQRQMFANNDYGSRDFSQRIRDAQEDIRDFRTHLHSQNIANWTFQITSFIHDAREEEQKSSFSYFLDGIRQTTAPINDAIAKTFSILDSYNRRVPHHCTTLEFPSSAGIARSAVAYASKFISMGRLSKVPSVIKLPKRFQGCATHTQPHSRATGALTSFIRNPQTGKIIHYEEFRPQTNPKNPNLWESVKRFDNCNSKDYHFNKVLDRKVYEPHIHCSEVPGGVIEAAAEEIPFL